MERDECSNNCKKHDPYQEAFQRGYEMGYKIALQNSEVCEKQWNCHNDKHSHNKCACQSSENWNCVCKH